MSTVEIPKPKLVALSSLKPHPRNYRIHPSDQLEHLAESIRVNGFYGNVVAARDLTILKGHGTVEAALLLGMAKAPTVILPIEPDSPAALKILAGDNEISRLAEIDDRGLSELLREVSLTDELAGLLGTGYDDTMLASLVFVTRPSAEIGSSDAAKHWVGMPGYQPGEPVPRVVVQFDDEAGREAFMKLVGVDVVHRKFAKTAVWSIWWPEREVEDPGSLRFEAAE